jgi:hypothetical protein
MRRALCLALSLLVATPALAAPKPLTPEKQLARYKKVAKKHGCPGFAGIDLTVPEPWKAPWPALERHKALRASAGVAPPPERGQRLTISWGGGHHAAVGGSVAIVRSADGIWRGDGLHSSMSLIPAPDGTPPKPEITKIAWDLPAEDSAKMDTLVASPGLAVEPRTIDQTRTVVGGAYMTLEVFDAHEQRLASQQHAGRWGVAGQILDLAFSKAPN